ncbi:MAG: hypothetical protein ACPGUI_00555 [Halarcobacter sp.]
MFLFVILNVLFFTFVFCLPVIIAGVLLFDFMVVFFEKLIEKSKTDLRVRNRVLSILYTLMDIAPNIVAVPFLALFVPTDVPFWKLVAIFLFGIMLKEVARQAKDFFYVCLGYKVNNPVRSRVYSVLNTFMDAAPSICAVSFLSIFSPIGVNGFVLVAIFFFGIFLKEIFREARHYFYEKFNKKEHNLDDEFIHKENFESTLEDMARVHFTPTSRESKEDK